MTKEQCLTRRSLTNAVEEDSDAMLERNLGRRMVEVVLERRSL